MKRKIKLFTVLTLLVSVISFAQLKEYNYKRSLDPVKEDWHSITVPDDVFSKVSPSLNDMRIYGISTSLDTIEVPYILKIHKEKAISQKHPFEIINTSKTDKGFYFTFRLDAPTSINNIQLSFKDTNFDWKVNLEGSHDLKQWFTILENYRILDIHNTTSVYTFTDLVLPESSYRYFRVLVRSDQQPVLEYALISMDKLIDGDVVKHRVKTMKLKEDKSTKSSVFEFELENKVPVSSIKLHVDANYDYFRTINISYLSDSIHTEKGWRYNYRNISTATLNSLESNDFKINKTIAQKFRISVLNGDNQSLDITSVAVKGYKHELIARFTQPADYVLAYGNEAGYRPNYDIRKFKNTIPAQLTSLGLGEEVTIDKIKPTEVSPLFENEWWLWVVMGIVITLLAGFTFKMLSNTNDKN
ncbi:DUF3999 family protein [uncultured Nonlabens sp.]|uniref:DUF3999 family protein n=1 Tax=uncultured Nonlabens sp. TaxID=859306 RepID=UPI00262786AE|nr:DUF3999 family protein [uncultured Nonlabens sp.]